jgi:CRP-like cAMP-binding protein
MSATRRQAQRWIDQLRGFSFLASCTRDELARVDRLGTLVHVQGNRTLIREGTAPQECFLAFDGVASVKRADHSIAEIGAGSIAGELAFLDHTTRSATVSADTPMKLLVLDRREFSQLLHIAPHIESALQKVAEERRRPPTRHLP